MSDPAPSCPPPCLDYTKALEEGTGVFQRFPLVPVAGIPLMEPIAQQWGPIAAFRARPDDLLIATYPKSGTTWMQEIVDLVLCRADEAWAKRAPTHVRSPFLEICSPPPIPSGVQQLEQTPSPRVIKTHLPIPLVPKSFWDNDCKVIYVARNPKDTVVSYYFFDQMNKTQPEPGPWPTYLQRFMNGELAWGSWYDHVCGYWVARETHRILYVFYEDMKKDPRQEVQRVASFLGVALSPEALARVIQLSSFVAMRDNPMANYSSIPRALLDPTISPFMRRGEVGDWKNHFTVAQNKAFDTHYQNRMAGPGVPHFRSQV